MSPQAGWILQEEIVPRLRASIPRNVNQVGAEDPEELIQDATCMAAKLMHAVELQGKTVTAGNIAYYTILHMKSGRRSYGISTTDVCGISTQLNGSTRLSSLEEPAAMDGETGGELLAFHDVLSQDQDDPGMIAARKLDWQWRTTFAPILISFSRSVVNVQCRTAWGSAACRRQLLKLVILPRIGIALN